MSVQKDAIETSISMSIRIIRMYDWLLDLFVLDFFVDDHWHKLPRVWRECFTTMDPQDLGKILSGQQTKHMLPLSLLSLLKSVEALTLPRAQKYNTLLVSKTSDLGVDMEKTSDSTVIDNCGNHPKLKNLFLRGVKLKKRHEIALMADAVAATALSSKCGAVVDFGSGLGHLLRVLAYKHDLHAVGIECQSQLTKLARKHDMDLEYFAKKCLTDTAVSRFKRPTHLNCMLSSLDQLQHLSMPTNMEHYGLVGLHPCGDLGPLLLKHFVSCNKVKFICVVGCCFMKLTCDTDPCGYPMSEYVKKMDSALSYYSRELACHAIEVYCERLMKGDYKDLKVHAYRAALERILIEHDPKLKHAPIRSIKHTDSMTFESYCEKALERLALPVSEAACARGHADLRHWRRVVFLYVLRLALAPLVETVVLLDRVLYVLENGLSCNIYPVFDPKISPRNHIIIGRRLL